jgi:glucose/arabinose dehydrogenase
MTDRRGAMGAEGRTPWWSTGRLVVTIGVWASLAAAAADAGPGAPGERADVFTAIDLELVAEGLVAPHFLTSPPGDPRRFVVDQVGTIHVLDEDDTLLDEPFLDLRDSLVVLREQYDERGLLGLAFHPDFAENGRLFVYYTAPLRDEGPERWDHTDHLSEFAVSDDDANRADPGSERIVLQIDQPQMNHNGGALAFGPDGYLYVSVGDGGDADDTGIGHPPLGHGQDITTILGNVLRIDVDGDEPYGIPDDNPFVGFDLPDAHPFSGDEAVPEIWAWGFRHPWRMTFDRDGEHGPGPFVSDAGENLWEEVSLVAEPGNYGWNIKEGRHWFDPDNPHQVLTEGPDTGHLGEPLIDPIIEYMNNRGRARGVGVVVIGGYLYRGEGVPGLEGHYVFGDWSRFFDAPRGVLMVAAPADDGAAWPFAEVMEVESGAIQGFGEDADGELYVLVNDDHGPVGNGRVYRIVPAEGR